MNSRKLVRARPPSPRPGRTGPRQRPAARSSGRYLLTVQKSTPHTLLNVTPCTLERKA